MGWVVLHWGTNDHITPRMGGGGGGGGGSLTNTFYNNLNIFPIKTFPHLVGYALEDKLLPAYIIIVNS